MDDFGHYLKVRYGLPPDEPTLSQLGAIQDDITTFIQKADREPNDAELRDIVARHCPKAGTYKYGADVNAELRRQIALLAAATRGQKR